MAKQIFWYISIFFLLGNGLTVHGQSNRLKEMIRTDSLNHARLMQEHQEIRNYHLEAKDIALFRIIADSIETELGGELYKGRHRKEKLKKFFDILHRDLTALNALWLSTNQQFDKLHFHQTFLFKEMHRNPIYSVQQYKELKQTLQLKEHKKNYQQLRQKLAIAEFTMMTSAWNTYSLFNSNIDKRLMFSELFAYINLGFKHLQENQLNELLQRTEAITKKLSTQTDSMTQVVQQQASAYNKQRQEFEKQEKTTMALLLANRNLSDSLNVKIEEQEGVLMEKNRLLQLKNSDLQENVEKLEILNTNIQKTQEQSQQLEINAAQLTHKVQALTSAQEDLLYQNQSLLKEQQRMERQQFKTNIWLILLSVGSVIGIILLAIGASRLYRNKQKISRAYDELQIIKDKLQVRTAELRLSQRELNHRVKNNLQLISSLIFLQEDEIEDEEAREVFSALQGRIDTIKIVHQKLYAKKNQALTIVNMAEYIADLVKYIVGNEAEIYLDIPDIFVEMDHATDIGLIVNELVTNACKYAFPYVDKPQLFISLNAGNNFIDMLVRDNGPGFPLGFSLETSTSFGLKSIVEMFVHKSGNGQLLTYNNNGGVVEIAMPFDIKTGTLVA